MPGYEQYQRMSREIPGAVKTGALTVAWKDPKTFGYVRDGRLYRYDVTARLATEVGAAPAPARPVAAAAEGGSSEAARRHPRIHRTRR